MTQASHASHKSIANQFSWAQTFLNKVRASQDTESLFEPKAPLLPFTREIIRFHRRGHSLPAILRRFGREDLPYYRVWVDTSAPITRFRMLEANSALLEWVEKSDTGFDVLQLPLAGFQYHWRSDLARILEWQAPLVSQTHLVQSGGDLEIDHVASMVRGNEKGSQIEGCLVSIGGKANEAIFPSWDKVQIARRLTPCQTFS